MRQSLLLCFLLGTSCAGPQVPAAVTASSTYKNPTYRDSQFKKIAVWAKTGLQLRQELEGQAVRGLKRYAVDSSPSLDLWAIDSGEPEIQSKIQSNGIDAVLVLMVDAESEVTTARYTSSTTSLFWGTAYSEAKTTSTNEGRAVYTAVLFSANSGRVAWQSQASSAGNAGSPVGRKFVLLLLTKLSKT